MDELQSFRRSVRPAKIISIFVFRYDVSLIFLIPSILSQSAAPPTWKVSFLTF